MPLRPPPTTYVCEDCGWEKTVWPRSDVLLPGDVVHKCEKCHSDSIEKKKGGWFKAIALRILLG